MVLVFAGSISCVNVITKLHSIKLIHFGWWLYCTPGVHCDMDIQECDSSPCIHGNCVDKVAGYTCFCWDGFEGDNCQIDIDECAPSPCSEGATCIDGPNRLLL